MSKIGLEGHVTTSSNKAYIKSKTVTETKISRKNEEAGQIEEMPNECGEQKNGNDVSITKPKKKTKHQKNKKGETDKHNISVKSSRNVFDALQKRNLIHVRSINASTAHEKFSQPQGEVKKNCYLCDNPVYKMEEVKAETNIYHKNCFRCNECNKQLKLDTYQSHESVLYCTVHFKLLFAPKFVEDDDRVQPLKPELIIRENQPTELPPDVVRASDKPDLGLEELQQLNIRSRFQVFEQEKGKCDDQQYVPKTNNIVRWSTSILSKVAKLQQLGSSVNSQQDSSVSSENEDYENVDFESTSDNPNADLIRQKKREHKRERPIGIGETMNDIRTLFEKGHGMKKEERREERKQEIQNIRSRLFMGKQARIREMYQQAVADSEHASAPKCDIDIEVDSKTLRERFEKGESLTKNQSSNENHLECPRKGIIEKEGDIFQSAISKKSRSIFIELDANVVSSKNQGILPSQSTNSVLQKSINSINGQVKSSSEFDSDVVKSGETLEDVKIETSEISEKFKFFEKYHPSENKKRVFRITPPREGVVKMPEEEEKIASEEDQNLKELSPDRNIIAHSRTTSMMLNKFRELEKNQNRCENNNPKPLKCFTPPPDGNRRLYVDQDSDEYDSSEENDDEEDDESEVNDYDDYNNGSHLPKDDEALREALNAARAKQLRIKFEKWQANEIKREKDDELHHNIHANNASDENSIESTQTIMARFEKMQNVEKPEPARPRYKVNRFV